MSEPLSAEREEIRKWAQAAYTFGLFELACLFRVPMEQMPSWLNGFSTALRFVAEHPEQTGPLAAAYVRAENADSNIGAPPPGMFADIAERFPQVTANILATLDGSSE